MRKNTLYQFLSQLGLQETVFFKDKEGRYAGTLHFDIQNKLKLINPDAIYIFNHQPLILFFDLTHTDKEQEANVHKKIWSFDNSPIAFVIKDTEVKVYNALHYIKSEERLAEIDLSQDDIIEKFSFWNLQSNTVWKWFGDNYLKQAGNKAKKRVNEMLFQNIKCVRKALIDKENDPDGSIPNALILRLIFIRYLIDRNITIGAEYIQGDDTLSRRLSFSKLLQDPHKLSRLFVQLNDRFNGVLFKNIDAKLTPAQAKDLANVFRGEIPEEGSLFYGSDFYFDVFDFSIIPVEVISGIYESLIDPETRDLESAVYTPSFLVEYILKDTLDVFLNDHNTSECKIFEVAVGSGIFLVQSLRRMIEKEIELNGNSDQEAFSERIRSIAKHNLYGVDINEEALKVACFSIYIALLDYQEPKNINIYQFPNLLGENLFKANFFNTKHQFNQVIKDVKPRYILGNPPWKSNKDATHVAWLEANKKTVGRFEIAQSFLLRTKDFMDVETKVALIVTSTIFYNVSKTTRAFKTEFLSSYCIHKFLDLSPVRRLIFEEKDSPASVVYYQLGKNKDYLDNIVQHQSVKINYFLKHFKMLVIEKFDQKRICQRHFLENDWMFKLALYGNTLDFSLITKLGTNGNKLYNHLKSYTKGAGILSAKTKNVPLYQDVVGEYLILNEQINQYFSNVDQPHKVTEEEAYLKSGKIHNLYKGCQVLFKEQAERESHLVISLVDKPYVFKKGIFGISSFEYEDIEKLYTLLISNLYTYYLFLISGSWGTSTRPQIRWKEEYLSFPYIEDHSQSHELQALTSQFLRPYKDFYTGFNLGEPYKDELVLSKMNDIINDIYNINEYQKDLIDYVLNVSRYQFQASKQHLVTDFTHLDDTHYRNKTKVLTQYATVLLNEFDGIYEDEYLQAEIYYLDHFVAINFVLHAAQPAENIIFNENMEVAAVLKRLANTLSISQITNASDPTKNLFIQKDIKGFEANSFYIIKPNEYKCWHRSMAWYDVAEFKAKIEDAELAYLNDSKDE